MSFCFKCESEYFEPGEPCMCRQYRRWMEEGYTNRVPLEWKLDNWDGYINAPDFCEHMDVDEWMDGSAKCKQCGFYLDASKRFEISWVGTCRVEQHDVRIEGTFEYW